MATIATDRAGKTVQFYAGDGKRRSIRLGRVTMKAANNVKRHIEAINIAKISGQTLENEHAEWIAAIEDKLHKKLARAGLVESREAKSDTPSLGEFLDDFMAKRQGEKASTLSSIRLAVNRLKAYFGAKLSIDAINPGMADDWLTWMKTVKKYAGATIGRTVKHAKRFFRSAERLKLIPESPFADLKSQKQTNESRKSFVSQDVANSVLDVLPDVEWRLIFALSRYGGLRCPSEHLALTWLDVDWDRARFRVVAPKTGERWVPIFAELRPYLEAAFDSAPEGALNVITRRRASSQRWGALLGRILKRAHISQWPKIWHQLRASRQTELTALYSIGTVCRWLGNSIEIADAHYLSALESEFDRAANVGALRNPVQQMEANEAKWMEMGSGDEAKTQENAQDQKNIRERASPRGARNSATLPEGSARERRLVILSKNRAARSVKC